MSSILFVCTANRFRSPLAASYFSRMLVQKKDHHGIRVSSAGTWTQSGLPATTDAQNLAAKVGLDLSEHQSRLIEEEVLSDSDLVLVMDSGHKEAIRHEFPSIAQKVYLLSEVAIGVSFDIADPYTTSEPPNVVAREIFELIDDGYERILSLAWKLEK
jgi:protein-tyrosine-phosphatase